MTKNDDDNTDTNVNSDDETKADASFASLLMSFALCLLTLIL